MENNNENLPDELNPKFIFSLTHTDLLVKVIRGEIDLLALVRSELANRGLDRDGKWVGFDEAKRIHSARKKNENK